MRRAWKDLKQIALPLVIAVAVGAWIHDYVPASLLERLSGPGQWWAIPLAAVLGVPVYASVVVLLPLGTSLLAKGVGVGVVTAFLLGATGFSLPEGMILYKILPRPLLVRLVVVFTFGVISLGYLFQAIDHRGWLPNRARAAQPVAAISAGPHAAH